MKKITSIFLALALVLLSSSAYAVTLGWDKWVSGDGIAPTGYYIYKFTGTYVSTSHATAQQYDAGLPTTTPLNEFTINETFTKDVKYIFVATAYAPSSDGMTRLESGDSNTAEYIFRGDGFNNPTGTLPIPLSFNVLDQNTVQWAAGTGTASQYVVGYRMYYYVASNSATKGSKDFMGASLTSGSISDVPFTVNVPYKLYLVSLVYDTNGIGFKESTASNTDDFTKVSGPTGTPSKPKNLVIKP